MKWMNVFQACTAAGVLMAGLVVAANAHATMYGHCDGTKLDWGYTSPSGGDCWGMGTFVSGNKGASNAYVGANLGNYTAPDLPTDAIITGLDSSGNPISGCSATDTSSDGTSVAQTSGCSSGVYVTWRVDYEVLD